MSSSSSSSTTPHPASRPTSSGGSTMPSVERAAVFTHGRAERVVGAVERLHAVAAETGVAVVGDGDAALGAPSPNLAIVLGGDGTMLRALTTFLGTGVPVFGVNFGRVGFLTAAPGADLETGAARLFAGDYRTLDLPTLELSLADRKLVAVNDVVITSATLGRMLELDYA